MNKDIIRIAKAMGAQFTTVSDGSWAVVNLPNGRAEWNPLTSHDDCHALIEWLNRRGFHTMIHYMVGGSAGVRIEHDWEDMDLLWSGDDYRQGVVELTLKLLDESDE